MAYILLSTSPLWLFFCFGSTPLRKCFNSVEFKFSINGPWPFTPSNVGHYRYIQYDLMMNIYNHRNELHLISMKVNKTISQKVNKDN